MQFYFDQSYMICLLSEGGVTVYLYHHIFLSIILSPKLCGPVHHVQQREYVGQSIMFNKGSMWAKGVCGPVHHVQQREYVGQSIMFNKGSMWASPSCSTKGVCGPVHHVQQREYVGQSIMFNKGSMWASPSCSTKGGQHPRLLDTPLKCRKNNSTFSKWKRV